MVCGGSVYVRPAFGLKGLFVGADKFQEFGHEWQGCVRIRTADCEIVFVDFFFNDD